MATNEIVSLLIIMWNDKVFLYIYFSWLLHSQLSFAPQARNEINLLAQIEFDNRNNNKVSAQLPESSDSSVRVKDGSD